MFKQKSNNDPEIRFCLSFLDGVLTEGVKDILRSLTVGQQRT